MLCRVAHVGDEALGLHAVLLELGGQGVETPLVPRDQADGVAFLAEAAGHGGAEALSGSDDRDGRHTGPNEAGR